ncbi:universal stress protein [Mycolicibacterium sp. jd]|uniref:universal stress protein n=1 Tax=unclassified Mycolicibacterium TaxID=2636767 RepID=UPI00351B2438
MGPYGRRADRRPNLIDWDGSAGAETAFAAATHLFPERTALLVTVGKDACARHHRSIWRAAGGRDILGLTVERGRGFLGSRRRPAARQILVGSVATGTLHHSHRPVMVVPGEWRVPLQP